MPQAPIENNGFNPLNRLAILEGGGRTQDMQWGEELRSFRARNNIKQEATAHMLGVSQAYVSRIESGTQAPSADVKLKLKALLSEPAHRPVLDYIKALVSHSPHIMFLLSQRDSGIWVEAASQSALDVSARLEDKAPKIAIGQPVAVYENEDAFYGARELIEKGGFEGRLAFVDCIWTTRLKSSGSARFYRNTLIPVRDEQGRWFIHGTTRTIDTDEYQRLKSKWRGPVLCFDFKQEVVLARGP